jgi:hypothetical protein
MRIIDWLRGRERPPQDRAPDGQREPPEGDEDWAEDDELPGDEDDPTVYPLW